MLNSITLLGSSSGRNAGDAALMSGIMDCVDAACGERLLYEIPTIKPGFVRENYANRVRAVGMLPWNLSVKMLGLPTYRSVMRTDLTLIFDAILFDRALFNPLFNFLSTLYLILPQARKRGKKMGFYDVGTGPVNTKAGRRMLREISDMMDFITVRDQDSYDILMDIGVKNPRILQAADAAVNVQPSDDARCAQILERHGLKPGEPFLAANINIYLDTWAGPNRKPLTREQFMAAYVAAMDRVMDRVDAPVVFVVTQHADVGLNREVIGRLRRPERTRMVTNVEYSNYDIKGFLGKASLLCGMRLHSMILASSALTPIVGLAYQPKVHHYFRTLGLEKYSMSFDDFSAESLERHILEGWAAKDAIRKRLEERIPVLQREARKAADLVASLRRGEHIDAAFGRIRGA
jgi:polysaccharide pyruvyl transferase WcaK-like protein